MFINYMEVEMEGDRKAIIEPSLSYNYVPWADYMNIIEYIAYTF